METASGQNGPALNVLALRGSETPAPTVRYAIPFDLDRPGRYVFYSELWGDDRTPPPYAHFDTDCRLWTRTQIVEAGVPAPGRDKPCAVTVHDLPELAGGRWWLVVEFYRADAAVPPGAIWGDLVGAWTVAHVSRSENGPACGNPVPWRWILKPRRALLERSPCGYPPRYSGEPARGQGA